MKERAAARSFFHAAGSADNANAPSGPAYGMLEAFAHARHSPRGAIFLTGRSPGERVE